MLVSTPLNTTAGGRRKWTEAKYRAVFWLIKTTCCAACEHGARDQRVCHLHEGTERKVAVRDHADMLNDDHRYAQRSRAQEGNNV